MLDPQDLRVTSYLPQPGYGAGGMSVGLTTSGIIVHHIPSGIGISCDSERSQHANKERALVLLESLVIALSTKTFEATMSGHQDIASMPPPDRVRMIKEVREYAGCGLKEAKEAVDKMGTFEGAMLYLTGSTGYCSEGGACVCGGDLPAIREGCHNWKN
ncbi:peptide chain release factor 1 [Pseudomonas phage PHB09]|uniref:Peptide chain release factor 1 n=1 Tax=Pseudomonas phage PHB09 TaxID=2867265 RepID=A0AAE9BMU0_9CAUD|nr:peptide chain release factor 1 [Pseudomonas phage PHB09]UAV84673.1 peptide chain release factor 1 [Pseudomonas phage PHB09]